MRKIVFIAISIFIQRDLSALYQNIWWENGEQAQQFSSSLTNMEFNWGMLDKKDNQDLLLENVNNESNLSAINLNNNLNNGGLEQFDLDELMKLLEEDRGSLVPENINVEENLGKQLNPINPEYSLETLLTLTNQKNDNDPFYRAIYSEFRICKNKLKNVINMYRKEEKEVCEYIRDKYIDGLGFLVKFWDSEIDKDNIVIDEFITKIKEGFHKIGKCYGIAPYITKRIICYHDFMQICNDNHYSTHNYKKNKACLGNAEIVTEAINWLDKHKLIRLVEDKSCDICKISYAKRNAIMLDIKEEFSKNPCVDMENIVNNIEWKYDNICESKIKTLITIVNQWINLDNNKKDEIKEILNPLKSKEKSKDKVVERTINDSENDFDLEMHILKNIISGNSKESILWDMKINNLKYAAYYEKANMWKDLALDEINPTKRICCNILEKLKKILPEKELKDFVLEVVNNTSSKSEIMRKYRISDSTYYIYRRYIINWFELPYREALINAIKMKLLYPFENIAILGQQTKILNTCAVIDIIFNMDGKLVRDKYGLSYNQYYYHREVSKIWKILALGDIPKPKWILNLYSEGRNPGVVLTKTRFVRKNKLNKEKLAMDYLNKFLKLDEQIMMTDCFEERRRSAIILYYQELEQKPELRKIRIYNKVADYLGVSVNLIRGIIKVFEARRTKPLYNLFAENIVVSVNQIISEFNLNRNLATAGIAIKRLRSKGFSCYRIRELLEL